MNYDILFCINTDCPLVGKCERSTKHLDGLNINRPLSFCAIKPEAKNKCRSFIPLRLNIRKKGLQGK